MKVVEAKSNHNKKGINVFFLVIFSSIVLLILNVFFYRMHETIDYFELIINGLLLLTTFYLIYITQQNSTNNNSFYYYTSIGFSFVYFALFILTLDIIYLYEVNLVKISVNLLIVVGYGLIAIGITKWIKYNNSRKDELSIQANTDELTGLLNRRSFTSFVNFEFNHLNRSSRVFSIIIVDIDYFKTINDQHGHLVGDQVLKELAVLMENGFRRSDKVCRWGGEEFAILLPDTNLDNATVVANKLRMNIENFSVNLSENTIKVTISAGVSESLPIDDNVDDIINRADKALYQAKNKRNSVRSV